MRFSFRPRGPYDFARTAKFGVAPPLNLRLELFAPLLDYWVDGEYRRCLWAGGRPVLLRLRQAGSVERPRMEGATWPEALDPATQADVADAARRIADADTDLSEFYAALAGEPRLARLAAAFRGLKIFRSPSLYESLVMAVLEQQVNFNFAGQVKAALVARYGTRLDFEGAPYSVFPAPERLAGVPAGELRELKISGQKANYIRGLSEAAMNGLLHPNGASPTVADLVAHKGVGPWTANYVALRVFGARDALPSHDVGLLRAAGRHLAMRGKVTPAKLERRLRRLAGWRGYVTWYLWHTEWERPEAVGSRQKAESRRQ